MTKVSIQTTSDELMAVVFAGLHRVVEIGARLRHSGAPNSLSHGNHYNANRHNPWRMDSRLPTGEEVRSYARLYQSHGMCLAVLVTVGKEERGDEGDRRIVGGCRIKLEEVKDR